MQDTELVEEYSLQINKLSLIAVRGERQEGPLDQHADQLLHLVLRGKVVDVCDLLRAMC